MPHVTLVPDHIRDLVLAKTPGREPLAALDAAAKVLQEASGIDAGALRRLLIDSIPIKDVPLFYVALLADHLHTSVEQLLYGVETIVDRFDITPDEDASIASAESFVKFIQTFEVVFPQAVWEYAFPKQRRGKIGVLNVSAWIETYAEFYEQDPLPRAFRGQ